MATYIWQSEDGNWDTATSWDLGAAPGVGDDVVFPASSIQSVTAGLDQSAINRFGAVKIFTGYTGSFGERGSPLILSAASVVHNGSGALHIKDGGNIIDLLTINCAGRSLNTVQGDGTTDIIDLRVASGNVEMLNLDCDNLYVTEVPKPSGGGIPSRVVIDASCDTLTFAIMNRGTVFSGSSSAFWFVSGGTLTFEETAVGSWTLMQFGGVVIVNSAGGVARAEIMGGLLDFTRDTRPKTISLLRVWPGATAILPDYVTVTSGGPLVEPPYWGK